MTDADLVGELPLLDRFVMFLSSVRCCSAVLHVML
jgi:hypothetical protein